MMKSFITLLLVLLAGTWTGTQAVELSMAEWEHMNNQKDSLQKEIDRWKLKCDTLKRMADYRYNQITTLKEKHVDDSTLMVRNSQEMGQQMANLRQQMAEANSLVASLRQQVDPVKRKNDSLKIENDRLKYLYANGRLSLPYTKEKVDRAIKMISEVSNGKLEGNNKDVFDFLTAYPQYWASVRETLKQLQEIAKEGKIKTGRHLWVSKVNAIINSNDYYRLKKDPNGVSIYYLDDLLKQVRKRVDRLTPGVEPNFEDFILLLTD